MNFAELSGSSRLLFMTVIGLSSLRDGFTVRDFWCMEFNVKFENIFVKPVQCIEMILSLTMNDHLFEFLRVFNNVSGIFIVKLLEHLGNFFFICFIGGLQGHTVPRRGKYDRCELVCCFFFAERMV